MPFLLLLPVVQMLVQESNNKIAFMKGSVTSASEQGPREYQEDFSVTKYFNTDIFRGWLLAVFDGHGGNTVAQLCAEKVLDLFEPDIDPILSLKSLCVKLNEHTEHLKEGSTLSIALVNEDTNIAHIAILGDSPVVTYDGVDIKISPEHNVRSNMQERQRAQDMGGIYSEGFLYIPNQKYGLQLSRSLGDSLLESVLSREPEIYTVSNLQWILVASDGLLDDEHGSTKHLLEEIKTYAKKKADVSELLAWATQRGLHDNATGIVWSRLS